MGISHVVWSFLQQTTVGGGCEVHFAKLPDTIQHVPRNVQLESRGLRRMQGVNGGELDHPGMAGILAGRRRAASPATAAWLRLHIYETTL